ncbi:flavodoxin family protein [Ruminococcaceae bacterium OttesenSCG-928-L11]|nr:flavodoxin family protein [Ruminococcaceae bacterium OttesenSCG-928-L11]
MNVLVLSGSPHLHGSSSFLEQSYTQGLREAGHSFITVRTAFIDVNPCRGCDSCTARNGTCIYRDGMLPLYPLFAEAERIALITPLHYTGMTVHLKKVLDRLYAMEWSLGLDSHKELDLLAVCGTPDPGEMAPLVAEYEALGRHFKWRCLPPLLACGYYTRQEIERSAMGERAREKGRATTPCPGPACNVSYIA